MFSALHLRADIAQCSRHVRFVPMNGHLRGATAGASNRTTGAPLGDPASAAIEWRVAASRCPLVGLSQLGCIEGPTDVPTTVRAIHKRKGYSFRSLQGSLRPHRDSGGPPCSRLRTGSTHLAWGNTRSPLPRTTLIQAFCAL